MPTDPNRGTTLPSRLSTPRALWLWQGLCIASLLKLFEVTVALAEKEITNTEAAIKGGLLLAGLVVTGLMIRRSHRGSRPPIGIKEAFNYVLSRLGGHPMVADASDEWRARQALLTFSYLLVLVTACVASIALAFDGRWGLFTLTLLSALAAGVGILLRIARLAQKLEAVRKTTEIDARIRFLGHEELAKDPPADESEARERFGRLVNDAAEEIRATFAHQDASTLIWLEFLESSGEKFRPLVVGFGPPKTDFSLQDRVVSALSQEPSAYVAYAPDDGTAGCRHESLASFFHFGGKPEELPHCIGPLDGSFGKLILLPDVDGCEILHRGFVPHASLAGVEVKHAEPNSAIVAPFTIAADPAQSRTLDGAARDHQRVILGNICITSSKSLTLDHQHLVIANTLVEVVYQFIANWVRHMPTAKKVRTTFQDFLHSDWMHYALTTLFDRRGEGFVLTPSMDRKDAPEGQPGGPVFVQGMNEAITQKLEDGRLGAATLAESPQWFLIQRKDRGARRKVYRVPIQDLMEGVDESCGTTAKAIFEAAGIDRRLSTVRKALADRDTLDSKSDAILDFTEIQPGMHDEACEALRHIAEMNLSRTHQAPILVLLSPSTFGLRSMGELLKQYEAHLKAWVLLKDPEIEIAQVSNLARERQLKSRLAFASTYDLGESSEALAQATAESILISTQAPTGQPSQKTW